MVPRVLKPAVSASRAQVRTSAPVALGRVEGRPMPISMRPTLPIVGPSHEERAEARALAERDQLVGAASPVLSSAIDQPVETCGGRDAGNAVLVREFGKMVGQRRNAGVVSEAPSEPRRGHPASRLMPP